MLRSPLSLVFSVLLLVACGGRSNDDDGGGGNDSGGSASGGTSNQAGTHSGGSSSGGTSSGGSASVCDGFDDDLGYQLPVMITNEKASTIHVGAEMGNCGFVPLFEVADVDGNPLAQLGDCRQSCEQVMRNGPLGCPAICRFPNAVTLAPGEGTIEVWSGLFSEAAALPKSCVDPARQNDILSCDVARQIQPGTYTFSAQAGTVVDCSMTTGGPCGACMPDSQGGCTTPGVIAGDIVSAETTVELGPAYGVYDTARPASPAPGCGAGAAPAGMIQSVSIVFRDP
jgi:hypothetical protein